MTRSRLHVAVAAAVMLGTALAPPSARADGDPASDYLLVQSVFLPFNTKPDPDAVRRLSTIVREAGAVGFKIKVALIASRFDLGAVPQLYLKPQPYSQFLLQEIAFVYRSRLLVVMPNGFGYAIRGARAPAARRALAGLAPPGRDATKLVKAATVAVQRLARAAGHRLVVPKVSSDGSAWGDRLKIAVGVASILVLAAAIAAARRLRLGRSKEA